MAELVSLRSGNFPILKPECGKHTPQIKKKPPRTEREHCIKAGQKEHMASYWNKNLGRKCGLALAARPSKFPKRGIPHERKVES